MKHLIEAIARDLPKEIKNHHLVKRQDIYIPYREIGIVCLTKDTAEINIFYETILKLIDVGMCDINEIATIMGVEYKLLKEVIVDMIEERYLVTSQNKITMTKRGIEALQSRKLVTIQKKNLNQVMINMITGTIEESEYITITQAAKYDLCLNEVFSITKDFLESNYTKINDIYQKNQVESSIFQMRYISRELYKILDIAYDKLCFVKEELLIYKNNDSDDYEFIISKDVGGGYINAFYRQVKDIIYPGLENLFERNREFVKICKPLSLTENTEREQTDRLKKLLYDCDEITDEIYQEFIKTRCLIDDKEAEKYFIYQTEIQHDGIIISGNRLRTILNKKIINTLIDSSKKKIIIIYDNEEYDILNFLQRKFSVLINKGRMQLIKEEKIMDNYICFYPSLIINFTEYIANIFNNPISILGGNICFESNTIKEKVDCDIEKRKITFADDKKDSSSINSGRGAKKNNKYKIQRD